MRPAPHPDVIRPRSEQTPELEAMRFAAIIRDRSIVMMRDARAVSGSACQASEISRETKQWNRMFHHRKSLWKQR